jgi:hypothetical protein
VIFTAVALGGLCFPMWLANLNYHRTGSATAERGSG